MLEVSSFISFSCVLVRFVTFTWFDEFLTCLVWDAVEMVSKVSLLGLKVWGQWS
jgi:hypothetical protein